MAKSKKDKQKEQPKLTQAQIDSLISKSIQENKECGLVEGLDSDDNIPDYELADVDLLALVARKGEYSLSEKAHKLYDLIQANLQKYPHYLDADLANLDRLNKLNAKKKK